jgi:hypothetical protein
MGMTVRSDGFISRVFHVGRIIRAGTDLALGAASDYTIADNILLFTACYGLLIFAVKHFVIGTMLNMSFVDLCAYPLVYGMGIIGK